MVLLDNRYELPLQDDTLLIGKGAQARVYKGRDRTLQLDVAIKVIPLATDRLTEVAPLVQQYQLIQQFDHPNVVDYFSWGLFTYQQQIYFAIVMSYANYGTLDQYTYRPGPTVPRDVHDMFIGILEAIRYFNERGMYHRDLKPVNILLTRAADPDSITPIIADFLSDTDAIRNPTEISTVHHEHVFGTIEYMAPELLGIREVFEGPMTDIWSFGVIVYEFFTGSLPFGKRGQGQQIIDVATRILSAPVDTSALPAPYAQLVELCLVKDPAQRINDAQIGIELLKQARQKAPAQPSGIVPKTAQPRPPAPSAPPQAFTPPPIRRQDSGSETILMPEPVSEQEFLKKYGTLLANSELGRTILLPVGATMLGTQTSGQYFLQQIEELRRQIARLEAEKEAASPEPRFNIDRVHQLIEKNQLTECFQELNKIRDTFSHEMKKAYILIRGQWSSIKSMELLEVVEYSTLVISQNKVRYKLLEFIDMVALEQ